MATVIDPRFIEAFEEFLALVELSGYAIEYRKLKKKEHDLAWAKVRTFHDNKEIIVWVGPTVGLADALVRSIAAHEVGHVVSTMLRRSSTGDLTDEQWCNTFARLLVPDAPRQTHDDSGKKYTYLEVDAKRWFDDAEREALLDVVPHLVMRLPQHERSAVLLVHYDGKSLRDAAEELGVHHETVRRWLERAEAMLREQVR